MIGDLIHKLKHLNIQLDVTQNQLDIQAEKGVITESLLEEIKLHKEALIEFVQDYKSKKSIHSSIGRAEERANYPISNSQRRLWILSQFEGGSIAYNMPSSIFLDGEYNLDCFSRAINSVLHRHEILRTLFKEDDSGELRQWIVSVKELEFKLQYEDFRDEEDPNALVKAYVQDDSVQPFDLSQGPLIRASLLRVADNRYVFYFNMHHIISDGWSMDILSRDVMAYYEAYKKDSAPSLPELKIQFKDFTTWQLKQYELPEFQEHKKYWLQHLSGELPLINFPTQNQRPKMKDYNGASLHTYISADLTKALHDFVQLHKGSLFTGLLALWNVLIHKYTLLEDIVMGSAVAGRDHVDLSDQIGFYVNTLALRNRLDPETDFSSFYNEVNKTTLSSLEHQSYPFDQLVKDLGLRSNLGRSAIFDVILVLQNAGEKLEKISLSKEVIDTITTSNVIISKFDMQITFEEVGDYLSFGLNYDPNIYDHDMIVGLMKHFKSLLSAVMENPNQSIKEIDYLLAEEKLQLLDGFNQTKTDYPRDRSIAALFSEQVSRTPNKTAVIFEDSSLSYSELDVLSNQLAACLDNEYAVKAVDFVGITLHRSHWHIVSVLAILKLGASYVPIDPEYPKSRQDHLKTDSNCKLSIDQGFIEKFAAAKENYSTELPEGKITADQIAYVMYTSGSTGLPKGVLVNHRNVVRLVRSASFYEFTQSDTLLATGSFSFDATTFEFFGTLLNGATLVLTSRDVLLDERLLSEEIKNRSVTVMWFTAGWLDQLVSADISLFKELKTVLVGGDKLSPSHIKQLREAYPTLEIINGYGPTENTTFSLTYPIEEVNGDIPIGFPVSNSTAYVLDSYNRLVPMGVAGEICLGGDGLSVGYLNNPALTQERFITNPYKESDRLYKTGDLGRWLADGSIEYLGRMDHQVKIRGHRIELGEIEYQLQTKEGIHQGIVLLVEKDTQKGLVCYFVSDFTETSTELRNYLSQSLPDYMLPEMYVQLDELPLTVNGKVDRKALLALEGVSIDSGTEYVAPRNDVEERLVAIWQEVLHREKIGIHDDYFVLGGNSLLALKLINGYYKEFGVRIGVQDLFEHPVLASHVALLESKEKQTYKSIPKAEFQESYPLSNSQHRLWVVSQMEASSVAYNLPSTMVLDGSYDIDCFKRAVESVIARHDMLRTVFREDEHGEIRQWILSNDQLNFSIDYHDFSEDENPQQSIASYVENDSYKLFDLAKGPLLRTGLLRSSKDHYVFYYNMHHIISDGWSMEILARDVLAFYQAYKEDTSAALNELPIQYADYTLWQTQQMKLDSYKTDQTYWLERLSGELPLLDLPGQKIRPKIKSSNGRQVRTYLSPKLTQKLADYTSAHDGSLFIGILATLNALFYKYTGKQDIIIGSPVAGRSHPDLQDQIGFYVNNLPFRNSIDPKDSFHECYQKIKQTTLDGFSHQSYPFDSLVEDLDLQYDMSRTPVYDISLTLHNTSEMSMYTISDTDIADEVEDLGFGLCKNDIEFHFQESVEETFFGATYNSDVYDFEMIQSLMLHFKELLAKMLTNPSTALAELDYLSETERFELMDTFNDTASNYPKETTVLDAFSTQVKNNPTAIAVQFNDQSMSYEELDALSNQLSHCLVNDYEVKRGDLIGIQLDRSQWFVVAILGVLKSGAAYVPIDTEYPVQRKEHMIKDAGIELLLSDTSHLFDMDYYQGTLLALDVEFTPEDYSKEAAAVTIEPNDLAYVIYTSGSTGIPKGVLIAHDSLWASIHARNDFYDFMESYLLVPSFSFDSSVAVLWECFTRGSMLVVVGSMDLKDPVTMINLIKEHQIAAVLCVPSFYKFLLEESSSNELTFKRVILAGEALRKSLADKHYTVLPTSNLYNEYGPTENTVWSTATLIRKETEKITIGKPINNTKVFVLDENQQLVPKGVVGEIYLSGCNLAVGYLNRPELTEEKFIKNVIQKGDRCYRTGDLGRWMPDGSIDFIGRKDDQVKIRGYRIELGEIENRMKEKQAVKDAVVLAREVSEDEKELVAYVVSNVKETTANLRNFLSTTLPDYMIPAYYVQLEEIPLTANGKTDKKALPIPDEINMLMGTEYVAPSNEVEEKVVGIWQQVLKREKIGIKDDYFVLGGNSLLAIQLINEYHKEFGVRVDIKDLFENSTVEDFVTFLDFVLKQKSFDASQLNEIDL